MPKATFEYDALGRRIEKVDAIAGTTTRYYYDDQRVAVQTLVSGGVETDDRYFVFGNYIDEVLVMGCRFSTSWFDFYYGHDHLYSPTVLYGPIGIAVERYEYDAYGSVQILTSAFYPLASSQYGNPYIFTGRELDILEGGSLRLMYYRARTTDPQTGRFMQRDPLGINPAGRSINFFEPTGQYADGMNLYQYCQSDSVNYVDPWGLECGVVVKRFVSKGTGVSSWIDMGHEWLSAGSGSIGFWPNGAGIPGREWSVFSPDPGWRDMSIFNNCRKYVDVTLNGGCLSKSKRR